jgi:photosystem II stability/assembly factor-like uncharacterized protein
MANSTILYRFDFLILASLLLSNSCGLMTNPSDKSIPSGTWEIVRAKQDEITYKSIHFVDANVGWIVGEEGTIQNTVDGGISWDSQTSGVTGKLWDVQFIDNQTGWICGADNTVLKTANGGISWVDISPDQTVDLIYTGLEFINADVGWLSSNHGEILQTDDGGLTWELKKFFEMGGGSRLAVINANTVYALHGLLYRSFNCGTTWDSLPIPRFEYHRAERIYFIDNNNGWANTMWASGGEMVTYHAVFSTNDGGATWTLVDALDDDFFKCSYFLDANVGWVAGSEKIYRTIDGGDSWMLDINRDDAIIGGVRDMMLGI